MTRLAFRYRAVTILLTLLLITAGFAGLFGMSRREDPDIKPRLAQIVAVWPGASAEQLEELVADPLERALREVDDVEKVTSTSHPGFVVIMVEAGDRMSGTLDKLMDDIRERVADSRPSLPRGVLSVQVNDRFADTAALIIGVERPGATLPELEAVARRVRDRLAVLPGASEVKLLGEQLETIRIGVSSARMAEFGGGVTLDGIASAVRQRQALPLSGGSLPAGDARLLLAPTGEVRTLTELEGLAVASSANGPIYLSDVAQVSRGLPDPPTFRLRVNGQPSVAVWLTMRKGHNITDLGEQAEQALKSLVPTLPEGTKLVVINDLPTSVERRVAGFFHELELAIFIIFLVMMLFMGLRSALLVGAMLPLSILGTFAAMDLFGRDIQQMSIAALILALALVVDNSIVVLDNIEEKMQEGLPATEAALEGGSEIQAPLLTANLVAALAFLPLALMPGGVGDFIGDLGRVTALSLLVSVLLNLTVMPLLCERFLRPVHSQDGWVSRGVELLRSALAWLAVRGLRRPVLTLLAATASLIFACSLVPSMGKQFFPAAERDQFVLDIWLPEGTDLAATDRTAQKVEAEIRKFEGVKTTVAYVGRGGPRFYYNIAPEPPASNYAQIVVNTKSLEATTEILGPLQRKLDTELPGARITAKKLEQGPPVGTPIAIRLSGPSIPQLRQASEQVKAVLRKVPGAHHVHDDYAERPLELRLQIDQDRAAAVGLTSTDIATAARTAYSGTTVASWREGDRELPVELRLDAAERSGPGDLTSLHIPTPGGAVPLAQFAQHSLEPMEARIQRRNGVRTLTVGSWSLGRLPSAVLADAQKALEGVTIPPGVTISYGGESEESGAAFGDLLIVFVAAFVFTVVVLMVHFNSFATVGAILSAVPLGVIGAFPFLFLTGQTLGFMAFLGIAALGGVITNHTIFLFTYAEHMQGGPAEKLVEAGQRRLRPILLTVLLSVGALLPQALSGSPLWPPLDWAIIGGLLVSMVLTMVVVPSVYLLFVRVSRRSAGPSMQS